MKVEKLTLYQNNKPVVVDAIYHEQKNYVELRDVPLFDPDLSVDWDAATNRVIITKKSGDTAALENRIKALEAKIAAAKNALA